MSYVIKSWFVGQKPFSWSDVQSSPLHKIDLFRWVLSFRCPKSTYVNEYVDWVQPAFVDIYTKGSINIPENVHGKKELMTTGWQFRPSLWSHANTIKLRLSVALECLSQQESECKLNLLDYNTLISWVGVSYQQQLGKASQVNMFRGTDGTLAIEFNDKEEVQKRVADDSFLAETIKSVDLGSKDFAFFQIGSEMHYYYAISEKNALRFEFSLMDMDSAPLPLDDSVELERLEKINEFIMFLLDTIEVCPSNRLQDFLDEKNIQTR